MNDDLREAFISAALETFNKLAECPEIKNCRIYRDPERSFNRTVEERTALVKNKSRAKSAIRPLPFRWILVISAQKSARHSVLKVRGYRQKKGLSS